MRRGPYIGVPIAKAHHLQTEWQAGAFKNRQ
jgi:hypothetical protein